MNSHQASGKEKHFGHLLQAGEKWEEGLRPLFLPLPSLFTKIKAILSSGCSGVQRVPSPALGSSKLLNPLQHCWDVFCPELEATEAQPCEMASASTCRTLPENPQSPEVGIQDSWRSPGFCCWGPGDSLVLISPKAQPILPGRKRSEYANVS